MDKDLSFSYSQDELDKFVHICNNVFYNNYLENGELNNPDEIEQKIKTEICNSLVNFYGEAHRSKITDIVYRTEINFVYQTIGPVNSVEVFMDKLDEERTEAFNEKNGNVSQFQLPLILLKDAEKKNKSIEDVIKTYAVIFADCFRMLGANFTKTDLNQSELLMPKLMYIINNKDLLHHYIKSMKELVQSNAMKKITLSDNPQVNADLEFVGAFVKKVKSGIKSVCQKNNKDFGKVMYQNNMGIELDPVVKDLYPNCFVMGDPNQVNSDHIEKVYLKTFLQKMLRISVTSGGYICGVYDQGKIFLGSNLTDDTIIHEFIHAIEEGGFLKDTDDVCNENNKHEMFNEIVTDYFATLIAQDRIAQHKKTIISQNNTESTYSALFKLMENFLVTYLPELKETRMGNRPVEDFMQIIGVKQFERISALCKSYFELIQSKKVCQEAESRCLSVADYLAKKNEKMLYKTEISDIDLLQAQINREIQKVKIELETLSNEVASQKLNHKKQTLATEFKQTSLKNLVQPELDLGKIK